jgi:hypothetical protein
MLAFLVGLFRLVFLFGKGHRAVVLENLALRQVVKSNILSPRGS